jgi:hypothetical protein
MLVGAATVAWYGFQRSVLGAHWFEHNMAHAGSAVLAAGRIGLVLGLSLLALQAMLEARGGKRPFLAVIFLGIVPLMAALILQLGQHEVSNPACFIAGISPVTQLTIATEMMLPAQWQFPAPYHQRGEVIFSLWVGMMSLGLMLHWRKLGQVWDARRLSSGRK